jgi:hypothetical protein
LTAPEPHALAVLPAWQLPLRQHPAQFALLQLATHAPELLQVSFELQDTQLLPPIPHATGAVPF